MKCDVISFACKRTGMTVRARRPPASARAASSSPTRRSNGRSPRPRSVGDVKSAAMHLGDMATMLDQTYAYSNKNKQPKSGPGSTVT